VTATTGEIEAAPQQEMSPRHVDGGDLAELALRLLRNLPRPVHQAQLAGFLGLCRAHPLASAAIDYAERKQEQAGRTDQRLEHQFWGQLRERLMDLRPEGSDGDAAADRAAGRRAVLLAQHLVAENLLRLALTEDTQRAAAPRRGPQPARAARTGGERD
jgi:hypothetical protein